MAKFKIKNNSKKNYQLSPFNVIRPGETKEVEVDKSLLQLEGIEEVKPAAPKRSPRKAAPKADQ